MIRMATLHKVYLISLLVLLQTSQAGRVSAGTDDWTSNEPRGGHILDVAIDPATVVAQMQAPVIPTRTTTYYLVDRVINNDDFAKLANWGVNTAIVDFDVNGSASDWRAVFTSAAASKIDVVIWPSDWDDPRPNCGWEAPYPVTTNGDITKVKPLLDVASQYANFIGIVNAHESFWSCDTSFDEMAGLKDKLKAYALSKGREIKVWNYIDNLYDRSMLPDNQIERIMDVAVTWQHCAGNVEGTCNTSSSTSALNMILNDRKRIADSGAQVELVFLMQTFTTNGYSTKFTLAQLQDYSCQFLNTSSLDGFGFYTWQAGWWPDLHNWPELQPAIQYIYSNCTNSQGVEPTPEGFHAEGRYLLDVNGNNFIMRGVNQPHTWYPAQTASFAELKAKGANTVRVVLSSGQVWAKDSAGDVVNVINLCKTNKLVCVLEVHDTTGYGEQSGAANLAQAVSYWKEIKSVLVGQEAYVIINIGNQPYGNLNATNWINDTKNAIAEMRNAGFQHMLMVDAPNWGQDWQSIMLNNAADILASDPNGNTVFSIDMYGVYDTPEEVENYISTFVNAGLPLVIGQFGHLQMDGDPDEDAIMSFAETSGIGYLGWSWSGNKSSVKYLDMVTNFNPNSMTWWGKRIFYGENGICLTSVESSVYGGDRNPIVCRIDPTDLSPTNASSVNFSVTFSEAVTDVTVDDFVLTKTGITGASITGISGSGNTYSVKVNTGSGSGTIRLDMVDNDSIKDAANHSLGGVGKGNGNFRLGEVYTVTKSAPPLLSPTMGSLVSSLQPTFQWKDTVPAFNRYQMQVSANRTFTSLVIDETSILSSSFTPASELTPGSLYYWRVRGFNSSGDASSWSTAWSFKTPLAQSLLVSPIDGEALLIDRPAFDWDIVDGASQYNLQVSAVDSFSALLVNAIVSSTDYTLTKDLPQNKTLYWRVRARTSAVTGPWSVKWSFKTGNPPTVPFPVLPANGGLVKDYTPLFDWRDSSVPAGTVFKHYELQVNDSLDFTSPMITTTINVSNYTPIADLASNTKFYWRVRAVNTVGAEDHLSAWSTVWSLRTVIAVPQFLTVAPNPDNPLRPIFDWADATGPGKIVSYTIQISTNANFTKPLVNSITLPSGYAMAKDLPPGTTIYWRVRVNGANGPSDWATGQFVTP